ncbi:MAG: flavin reductase family protein, partial [Bacteroidetes bacterium]|nr:flavin reductase family protein [Bacteroidota bacterium]
MNDKLQWDPGTLIYPLPAVMVSCGQDATSYNIITIAWTGTICTQPAMCY